MRKELEAEPFERFNKLLDKVRAAKNAEDALLSLLKAQVRALLHQRQVSGAAPLCRLH